MKVSILIPPIFSNISFQKVMESIYKQTYSLYEVIVVDGPNVELDLNTIIVKNIGSKIKIVQNKGVDDNPIHNAFSFSSGDLILIVDCLDEFHPDKLKLHVRLFSENQTIGGILSGYMMMDTEIGRHSIKTAKLEVEIADILASDAVCFSDGIFRREWVEIYFSGLLRAIPYSVSAASLHFYFQTLLAGCRIIGLNQAINLRYKNIKEDLDIKNSAEESRRCLDQLLSNLHVVSSISTRKDKAIAKAYLYWSVIAFCRHETALGQRLFRKSINLDRSILNNGALGYFDTLIWYARKDGGNIDTFIKNNVSQLSPEFAWMSQYLHRSIARGYFYRAIDEVAFGRFDNAKLSVISANSYGLSITNRDRMEALKILTDHEMVFGFADLWPKVNSLAEMNKFVGRKSLDWIRSTWFINQAFAKFKNREYKNVPQCVINALLLSPRFLLNRGVISIFIKSYYQIIKSYIQAGEPTWVMR